jgi:mRNA interferase MazF
MMSTPNPNRGEVWLVRFDPSEGDEIQKVRPAVVMNVAGVGRLQLRIVVPITDWKAHYPAFSWFISISPTATNGLRKDSVADTFQVKSVSEGRFIRKLGDLEQSQIDAIAAAIALCVGHKAP